MINRREALLRIGAIFGGSWLLGRAGAETTGTTTSGTATVAGARGAEFTAAHITDVHVTDRLDAPEWFAKCLRHIHSHPSNPSMILNTGDCVMDVLKVDRSRADQLWKMWTDAVKAEGKLPMYHSLGNHDVWGYGRSDDDPSKSDPMYGKKLALQALGMDNPYYSFDHGDWHFISLDSIQPTGKFDDHVGWIGGLDDEQFEWLKQDLEATPNDRHVTILSHISIMQVCNMFNQQPQFDEAYNTETYRMHPWGVFADARRVIDLFKKHRNVKLCLSGHTHGRDRIELAGVTYICDGAVSGRWWKGNSQGGRVNPGYSLITFRPDGSFDHRYTGFGWKASPELEAEENLSKTPAMS